MEKTRRNVLRVIAGSAAITSANVTSAQSSNRQPTSESPNFQITNNRMADMDVTFDVQAKSSGKKQLHETLTVPGKRSKAAAQARKSNSQAVLPNITKVRLDLVPGTQSISILVDGKVADEFTLEVGPEGVPDHLLYSIDLTNDEVELSQELS